jgi:hypothetical protein
MVTLTLYVAQPVSLQQVVGPCHAFNAGLPSSAPPPDQDSVLAVEQPFLLKLDCGAAAAAHLRAEDVMIDVNDHKIAMLNQCGWLVRRQEPTTTMISCSVVALDSK